MNQTRRIYVLQINSNDTQQMQAAAEYVARIFNDKTEDAVHSLPHDYHLTAFDVPQDSELKEFTISSCMNLTDVAHMLYLMNDSTQLPDWEHAELEDQAHALMRVQSWITGTAADYEFTDAQLAMFRLCRRFLPPAPVPNVAVNVAIKVEHPQFGTTTKIEQRAFQDLKIGDVFSVGQDLYRRATSNAYPNYEARPVQWQINSEDLMPKVDLDLDPKENLDTFNAETVSALEESRATSGRFETAQELFDELELGAATTTHTQTDTDGGQH